MGDKTKIEWTRGDDGTAGATWNPTVGCTKVSPGCDHCYAERLVEGRMRNRYPDGFGKVVLHHDRLDQPLRWRRPRRVFVNSLSDLFEDQVPDDFIVQVFAIMAIADQHTFQILTKRPGRMASLLNGRCDCGGGHAPGIHFRSSIQYATHVLGREVDLMQRWPLPNVWLGTSVENQKWAAVRVPKLLGTPAAVRFLSLEPLLGPLPSLDLSGIDWVIVGGESGPGARPMHPQWARDLVQQCCAAGVAPFVKQLGSVWAKANGWAGKGDDPAGWPADLRIRKYPHG